MPQPVCMLASCLACLLGVHSFVIADVLVGVLAGVLSGVLSLTCCPSACCERIASSPAAVASTLSSSDKELSHLLLSGLSKALAARVGAGPVIVCIGC